MPPQKHYTTPDQARLYLRDGVGRKYSSDDEARFVQADQLSGAMLALIAQTLIGFEEAIALPFIKRRMKQLELSADREFEKQIASREAKHGECPEDLRRYLRSTFYDMRLYQIEWALESGNVSNFIEAPAKHHPLRKDYDRWMRRKAKN
jgi:hypothetical protein